jgi:hypothetical protein
VNVVVEVQVAEHRNFTALPAELNGVHQQLAGDALSNRLELLLRVERALLLEREDFGYIPLLVSPCPWF